MNGRRKRHGKRKTGKEYRFSRWILQHLPAAFRRGWKHFLEPSFRDDSISSLENRMALEQFQLRQITILYRGLILIFTVILILKITNCLTKKFNYTRNSFGKGEKEIQLELEDGEEKEEISFILEEQKLTKDKEEEIFSGFFRKLKKEIRGKNRSLQAVTAPLNFIEKLDGYPFMITYEPEDLLLIDWGGNLGEEGLKIPEGKVENTTILVEAVYKDYSRKQRIPVRIIPQRKKALSTFERFQESLNHREASSRDRQFFSVDTSWKEITVKETSRENLWKMPVLLLGIMVLLLLRNHSQIGEKKQRRHKQNMEDFPLIVHLLTLYMGAGLSFSNAVERICKDYEKGLEARERRYAFEQMRVMNHCLHMGLRPREVCLEWGNHFQEKIYGRFAMLMTQSFSKGAREIRSMMEKEQEEAFQVQIDYIRREGEESSTRLLFPMILLLFITMILVMSPAFMQFYGI